LILDVLRVDDEQAPSSIASQVGVTGCGLRAAYVRTGQGFVISGSIEKLSQTPTRSAPLPVTSNRQ
jgi:hypothetical protein